MDKLGLTNTGLDKRRTDGVSSWSCSMAHPDIENRTSFALEHLFLNNEEARLVFVALVQATFDLEPGRGLIPSPNQPGPAFEGETWGRDSAVSSYRWEPVFAFVKPTTDVVLIGHALPSRLGATETQVVFRVGPVGKVLRVVGDRWWVRSGGAVMATAPRPFEQIPLTYERAFGGWDRSHPEPARHTFEARNPVGRGFRGPDGLFEEGLALPNIEDPGEPIQRWGQAVTPVGVGFTSPHWWPRATLAGTYDEVWQRERMPRLPKNFDRRFFQAASSGLVTPTYLRGDEPVLVEGASAFRRLSFHLPGRAAPQCRVEVRNGKASLDMKLDTVVVDADVPRVVLQYRGHIELKEGPHEVRSIEVSDVGG